MVIEVVEDVDLAHDEIDICMDFNAKIYHPTINDLEGIRYHIPEVRSKISWQENGYECSTDWLITTMSEMCDETLGEYLTRYLNEYYPEFTFDEVEITGYNFRK